MRVETLVLGGKTGQRVATRLRAGGHAVRMGSRSQQPPFDWTDPSTWAAALHGVGAVYLVYVPDVAMPGAPDVIEDFAEQAVAAGARRLVMLSGQRAEVAEDSERRVRLSGADWTILHAAWFYQNFDEGFLLEPIRSGRVELPVGNAAEGFIDADDIADVAVAALTQEGHIGRTYELTGPRLLTFAEAIAQIAEYLDHKIKFVRIAPQEYADLLELEGMTPEAIEESVYLFTDLMDGRNAHLESGVADVLGRAPKDFRDYAARVAATGVWKSSE